MIRNITNFIFDQQEILVILYLIDEKYLLILYLVVLLVTNEYFIISYIFLIFDKSGKIIKGWLNILSKLLILLLKLPLLK